MSGGWVEGGDMKVVGQVINCFYACKINFGASDRVVWLII